MCIRSLKILVAELTTAKGHEVCRAIPRNFVEVMKFVRNLRNGSADNRLASNGQPFTEL